MRVGPRSLASPRPRTKWFAYLFLSNLFFSNQANSTFAGRTNLFVAVVARRAPLAINTHIQCQWTTFNGGSLGSWIDEERSKLRYVV